MENSQWFIKGWGFEEWLVNNSLYCGKILHIHLGKMCSVHYHKLKDETFYVLDGVVAFMKNNDIFVLEAGNTVHIPIDTPHCFGGMEDAKIIEISTEHFEDDSYRLTESGLSFDSSIGSFEEVIVGNLNIKE